MRMKADARNTLPLSTTPAFTPGLRLPRADATHWARALETAAAPSEPLHGPGLGGALPADAARSPATGLAPLSGSPPGLRDCIQHARGASLGSGRAAGFDEPARSPSVQPVPFAARATADMSESPSDGSAPERPARRPLSTGASETAPIRIHIEQQPGGLALWLGVDAQFGGKALAAMLQDLQQQCRGRLLIASIVCNGATVYAPTSSSKELP
jgi:hypothetical protein